MTCAHYYNKIDKQTTVAQRQLEEEGICLAEQLISVATQSTSPTNSHHVCPFGHRASRKRWAPGTEWVATPARWLWQPCLRALWCSCHAWPRPMARHLPFSKGPTCMLIPSLTWPGSYILSSPTSKSWSQWFSTSACIYIFRATNFGALRLGEAAGWLTSTPSSPPLEQSDQLTSGTHTCWPVLPLTYIFM